MIQRAITITDPKVRYKIKGYKLDQKRENCPKFQLKTTVTLKHTARSIQSTHVA